MSDTKTGRWENVEEAVKAAEDARATIVTVTAKDAAERSDEDREALASAKALVSDAVDYIQAERAGDLIAEGSKSLDWSAYAGAIASVKADEVEDPLAEAVEKSHSLIQKGENGVGGSVKVKALNVVEADSAGVLNRPERGPGDPTGRSETLNIVDLLTWVPVDETATEVEHPRLTTRTDNAGWFIEYDTVAGEFPRVAESDYRWDLVKTSLGDIGVGLPMSRRASLTDVRGWAETLIRYDIRFKVNNVILNGDGTNDQPVGILNTDGILALGHVDGYNAFDMVSLGLSYNAGEDVEADSIVFHPTDRHEMRILRESYETVDPDGTAGSGDEYEQGSGMYIAGGPAAGSGVPTWGVAQTVSRALPEGVALLAQFSGSAVRGRYQSQVDVKVGDQFEDFQARGEAKYLTAYQRGVAVEVVKPEAFILVELRDGAFADAGITATA